MQHILLIENDLMLLRALNLILKKHGYAVDTALNGKEALAALERKPYDLVLTDIMLPYANGFEIISRLKKSKMQANTPVIALTAASNEDTILDIFNVGADDYIGKPFVPGELMSRIRRLIYRKQSSQNSILS